MAEKKVINKDFFIKTLRKRIMLIIGFLLVLPINCAWMLWFGIKSFQSYSGKLMCAVALFFGLAFVVTLTLSLSWYLKRKKLIQNDSFNLVTGIYKGSHYISSENSATRVFFYCGSKYGTQYIDSPHKFDRNSGIGEQYYILWFDDLKRKATSYVFKCSEYIVSHEIKWRCSYISNDDFELFQNQTDEESTDLKLTVQKEKTTDDCEYSDQSAYMLLKDNDSSKNSDSVYQLDYMEVLSKSDQRENIFDSTNDSYTCEECTNNKKDKSRISKFFDIGKKIFLYVFIMFNVIMVIGCIGDTSAATDIVITCMFAIFLIVSVLMLCTGLRLLWLLYPMAFFAAAVFMADSEEEIDSAVACGIVALILFATVVIANLFVKKKK